MPTCPHCGDEFRPGGTYNTHVRNCDADPDEPAADSETELERLRERLSRLEDTVTSFPSNRQFETLWRAVMDANESVPSNSRLRDYDDALDRLSALESKLEKFTEECPACGTEVPAPHEAGRAECPACGETIEWKTADIPTFGGSTQGTVRTTR